MSVPAGGYVNRWLEVDLDRGSVAHRSFEADFAREYLGGLGFATRLLYDETGPETDPLGPDNPLIISVGPLVGTMAPTAARLDVTAKSPLTGVFGTANSGGGWASTLKYAGYDGVIVRGRARRPVYLSIDDGKVDVRDASHLWGMDAWDSQDRLQRQLSPESPGQAHVMSIGPAGENLVRYASITVDYQFSASRCGMGTVMGSKNLKAIAVRGTGAVGIARPAEMMAEASQRMRTIAASPWQSGGAMGRSIGANLDRENYNYPIKNFRYGAIEGFRETRGGAAVSKYLLPVGQACHCCPAECGAEEVDDPRYGHFRIDLHPNFIIGWGAMCGIEQLPAIWKCQEMCERLGLDSMSASATIAFAMEAYEKGLVDQSRTGRPLHWGDAEAIHALMEDIAARRGFGDLLAEGSRRAAEQLGGPAPLFAMHVKGLELINRDPRTSPRCWSLGALVSTRGGDNIKVSHMRYEILPGRTESAAHLSDAEYVRWYVGNLDMDEETRAAVFGEPPTVDPLSYRGKAAMIKWCEDHSIVENCMGLCIIGYRMGWQGGLGSAVAMYNAATGFDLTVADFERAAGRIVALQREYNRREGLGRKEDDWPERFYREPVLGGPREGATLDRAEVAAVVEEYYRLRGFPG